MKKYQNQSYTYNSVTAINALPCNAGECLQLDRFMLRHSFNPNFGADSSANVRIAAAPNPLKMAF